MSHGKENTPTIFIKDRIGLFNNKHPSKALVKVSESTWPDKKSKFLPNTKITF